MFETPSSEVACKAFRLRSLLDLGTLGDLLLGHAPEGLFLGLQGFGSELRP